MTFVKNLIIMIVLSALAVLFLKEVALVFNYLVGLHGTVSDWAMNLFSRAHAGRLTAEVIALVLLPFVLMLIVALIERFLRHKITTLPFHVGWIVWIVLLTAIAVR